MDFNSASFRSGAGEVAKTFGKPRNVALRKLNLGFLTRYHGLSLVKRTEIESSKTGGLRLTAHKTNQALGCFFFG